MHRRVLAGGRRDHRHHQPDAAQPADPPVATPTRAAAERGGVARIGLIAGPVRVFIACSLDGFIAGPGGDLGWLPGPLEDEDYGYRALLADTAAILMGRATYEVAAGFDGWPYGDLPVYVATARPLHPVAASVRAIGGTAPELLAAVRAETDGGIYLDGGSLIRSFLDAHLIDELTVTVVGVILGEGVPLFAGAGERHRLRLTGAEPYASGLVQLRYVPE